MRLRSFVCETVNDLLTLSSEAYTGRLETEMVSVKPQAGFCWYRYVVLFRVGSPIE